MKVLGPGHVRGQPVPYRPDGTLCDDCGEEARHLVITEADQFGAEAAELCSFHYLKFTQALTEDRAITNLCDLCHTVSTDVRQIRDPEEGSSGRIYDACPACRHRLLTQGDADDEVERESDPDAFDDLLPEEPAFDEDDDYFPEDDTHETPID